MPRMTKTVYASNLRNVKVLVNASHRRAKRCCAVMRESAAKLTPREAQLWAALEALEHDTALAAELLKKRNLEV